MYIGKLEVKNPVFLAPMAGVTDWAYRTICAQLGAGVTVTEMVSSRALVYKDKKSPTRILGLSPRFSRRSALPSFREAYKNYRYEY